MWWQEKGVHRLFWMPWQMPSFLLWYGWLLPEQGHSHIGVSIVDSFRKENLHNIEFFYRILVKHISADKEPNSAYLCRQYKHAIEIRCLLLPSLEEVELCRALYCPWADVSSNVRAQTLSFDTGRRVETLILSTADVRDKMDRWNLDVVYMAMAVVFDVWWICREVLTNVMEWWYLNKCRRGWDKNELSGEMKNPHVYMHGRG